MVKTINYLKEDGDAVKKSVDDNRTKLDEDGFPQEKYDTLISAQANLDAKDKAQIKSVKVGESKTAEEKETMQVTKKLLGKISNAVKSAFPRKKTIHAQFMIEEKVPRALEAFCSFCDYIAGLCAEYKSDLLKSGLTAQDIDDITSASTRIRSCNTNQQNAKKKQKAATEARDAAAVEFKDAIDSVRNYVKARYADNPEMLIAFEPAPKGGGGRSGETDTLPENPPAK